MGDDDGHATSFETVSTLSQLQDLVETVASASAPGTAGDDEELLTRIAGLERQLDSVTKCVACLVEDKDTILMPCRHLCMCSACAGRVHCCPICRASVADRQRSFIS